MDVGEKHEDELAALPHERRLDRLCELNVIEQVLNVCETTIVQGAWDRGKALEVHGWVYGLHDGLLKDLAVCVRSPEEYLRIYRAALESR
jgi:carbonic anhydrase